MVRPMRRAFHWRHLPQEEPFNGYSSICGLSIWQGEAMLAKVVISRNNTYVGE